MKFFNYEPVVTQTDRFYIEECIKAGVATSTYVGLFEKKIEEYLNSSSILCASGTSALHIALISLGLEEGDEVICPSVSFAATWNAIRYVRATPVFVDIEPDKWCIDVSKIEEKINHKTRAIICVDLYGNPCDYISLQEICRENNLLLVCDAAQSFGSTYNNKPIGTFGDISCFSFNLNKIITSLGGGAITLNNNKFNKERINLLINQNKKGTEYDFYGIGYNYRINSINASVGYSQLLRISEILKKKQQILEWYKEELSHLVKFQKIQEKSTSNNWLIVVKFKNAEAKKNILEALRNKSIEAKGVYKPAPEIKWIIDAGYATKCNNASDFYKTTLSLPSGLALKREDIKLICKEIKRCLSGKNV